MPSEPVVFSQPVSMDSPSRFFNRELSWLAFNQRVLEEAMNTRYPLLERLRFLAISGSNLDEFFMVRVAGILAQIYAGVTTRSDDGLTPQEQLDAINSRVEILRKTQDEYFHILKKEMEKEQIFLISRDQLSKQDTKALKSVFEDSVFPVLTPIALDPAHPFPWLANLSQSLIFSMKDKKGTERKALIPLPSSLPRFIRLTKKPARFIALEDVVMQFIGTIFPNFTVKQSGSFSIVRNSLLEVDERAEDLVRQFETALAQQKRGDVIALVMNQDMPDELASYLTYKLDVESFGVVRRNGVLSVRSLSSLILSERKDLLFKPYKPRHAERVRDFKGDHFAAIRKKDMVIHHPYESFEVVVKFLRQAAKDPDVVSIKQTLYRTNKNSPIVKALIDAARAGKDVTAVVELRARFDEEANIKWAKDMEQAGVHVVFGLMNYKTHAKISLVTRKENGKMKSYAHFGTGNYHEITANLYTDLSFFTCDKQLCTDAALVFNYLTGYAQPEGLKKLAIAPLNLRDKLLKLIDKEISYAEEGKPANIWAKMNSLLDDKLIDALYRASQAGVKISLVVRGICALRPGIPGFSENIKVKSIIGRFLEHARIFCFGNGNKLPSPDAKVFISSADWMQRNTMHRVETLVPIQNETVHEQIMGQIMQGNIKDEALSWLLHPDMTYTRVSESPQAFSCHQFFMTHPSLSGRGTAKLRGIVARQKKAVRKEERTGVLPAVKPKRTRTVKKAAAKVVKKTPVKKQKKIVRKSLAQPK
ncbi:MAG: RNA degradosome polyphosphate kinase [Alphaproteobacteria bacterium]|nr:RNA degradosome polyphosphate kinase [Alphaproteobacteria bacterium]